MTKFPLVGIKISVVMSVYNGQKYLREAIDSILNQTFSDFEFIIIDDGSMDGSVEIVKSYQDDRIVFIPQKNAGLAASLNRGVLLARADLIARMDQDDISLPERLEVQYDYLCTHADVIALGTAAEWITEEGASVCVMPSPDIESIFEKDVLTSPFFHPTVIFKREAFDLIGGYPEGFKFAPEDAVFFKKMHKIGRLENLNDVLLKYRLTPNSLSLGHSLSKKLMLEIVKKELCGTVTEKDYELVKLAARSVSPRIRMSAYHGLLARKYIWDNPNQINAIKNSLKSIYFAPENIRSYLILIAALVPLLTNVVLKIKRSVDKLFK